MSAANLQLDRQGRLLHFLTVEGLTRRHLTEILDTAESLRGVAERRGQKLPTLHGKTVVNLFEASTRTRTTFELAAKRLSADVLNLNIATSATTKGESLLDTLRNIEAMQCDMFVVRHPQSGAADFMGPPCQAASRSSTPAMAVIPIPPRGCWMRSPSAVTNRIFPACKSPSLAIFCIRGWLVP